uniref:SKP1-like protein n=1 Tax=Panagrellus redivivus TaxID=6233 RepID=A0A7E4VNN4_PANRE
MAATTSTDMSTLNTALDKISNIKLKCKDGKLVTISKRIIRESEVLSHNFSVVDEVEQTIPLPDIHSTVMKQIVAFYDLIEDDSEYVPPSKYTDRPTKDHPGVGFFSNFTVEELQALTHACGYLDMPRLQDFILCHMIVDIIQDREIKEIRERGMMKTDYTPEEEAEFVKRHEAPIEVVQPQ